MKTQYEDMFDYYKHTSMFWNDMIAMMSSKPSALMAVGPLRNFTENIKKRFEAYNWNVIDNVDGHNFEKITNHIFSLFYCFH